MKEMERIINFHLFIMEKIWHNRSAESVKHGSVISYLKD